MKKLSLSVIILVIFEFNFAQSIDTIQFANWINENSIELSGLRLKLADGLSDKTVIGLGECAHGSKTINDVRFDAAKALIENSAFNIVAFEMPFNIGLRINHFLQTGEGDIEQILKKGHFFTNSTEMLDFIKWIKKHNENADNPVLLYGFDVQSNIDLVEDLLKFYEKTINKEAKSLTITLIEIFKKNDIWSFGSYPASMKDSVMQIVSRLTEIHLLNRKDFVLASGFNEYEYSAKKLEILSNELQRINSSYGQSIRMRGFGQAELVKWIKDFEGEKSKIILFAHNGHLGKSHQLIPRARTLSTHGFYEIWEQDFFTGYYLSEIFDDDYYFIGTQFGSGY